MSIKLEIEMVNSFRDLVTMLVLPVIVNVIDC